MGESRSGSLYLDSDAERVYRVVLAQPQWGVVEVARYLGWAEADVRKAFDQLAALALLQQSVDDPNRWRPASRELSLKLLMQRQQAELQEMLESQGAIAKIIEEYSAKSPEDAGPEGRNIIGIDSVFARIDELAMAARHSLCAFVPNPLPSDAALTASLRNDKLTLDRGMTIRTIFAEALCRDKVTKTYMNSLAELGGQVRFVPAVPTRLLVYDREVALLPMDPADSRQGAVELRGPGVVTALLALFEQTWASATPLGVERARDHVGLDSRERELLQLLARGLTDEAVAKRLGISLRSVRRIVQSLMERFGAHSRFELGMRAAAKFYSGEVSSPMAQPPPTGQPEPPPTGEPAPLTPGPAAAPDPV